LARDTLSDVRLVKKLIRTNAPAYFDSVIVTNEEGFMTMTLKVRNLKLFSSSLTKGLIS